MATSPTTNYLLQRFVNRGNALLSTGVGQPGTLMFNEEPSVLNAPTDTAGSQSFFSLDLDDFSDGENSAQSWTRMATGLAPSDPFFRDDDEELPTINQTAAAAVTSVPTLGVRGQRQLVPSDGPDTRSKGQKIRDFNETVKGEFISGNEYLETTGRIDARAKASQVDLDRGRNNAAYMERARTGQRQIMNNDNDVFFANPTVAGGQRSNDEFFAKIAQSNAEAYAY